MKVSYDSKQSITSLITATLEQVECRGSFSAHRYLVRSALQSLFPPRELRHTTFLRTQPLRSDRFKICDITYYIGVSSFKSLLAKVRRTRSAPRISIVVMLARDLPAVNRCTTYRELKDRIEVYSIESFLTTAVILGSIKRHTHPFEILREVIHGYNRCVQTAQRIDL